jgi:uncharacterized protein YjbJ (UPF0337 family)
MKPRQSTEDRVEGTARTIKGRVKKAAGALTGDRQLEREGKVDELAGRVQKKGGEIERVFED